MYSRFIAVLSLFLVPFGLVSALPSVPRQVASLTVPASLASPTSITTTNTVQTANGTMIETCTFTLTPVGQQIQEVKNCTTSTGSPQVTTTLIAASSAASPKAAAAFVLPGTSLQVLPVGLVVYGGVTAIAILAVVFVTWERIRSRRTFRQQRMVESNSFGYGRVTKGGV